jgi:RNA polymerase sigma-70 factor (ECF subfamily)
MAKLDLPDELRDDLRTAWHRYLDYVAPLRPSLHSYCRRLTGNLWDAQDLVQDTLLRGFGTLGAVHDPVRNPRAYLLRCATNLWIDRVRRHARENEALGEANIEPYDSNVPAASDVRDAGARLLQFLAPRERAAVLLKDVFDLDLKESAEVLETTVGAVKTALHRGRARLAECESGPALGRSAPSVSLVDRFVELFNAGDEKGLLALMLDNTPLENVGVGIEWGREDGGRPNLHRALGGHPEWPEALRFQSQRMERVVFRGEPIILHFHTRRARESLDVVWRIEEEEGRIARLRTYGFCPETIREVGQELGLPVLTGPYRFPAPAPGSYYESPTKSQEGDSDAD